MAPTRRTGIYALGIQPSSVMSLLLFCAGCLILVRLVFVLAQVERHSDEARLGRRFQQELQRRGLLASPGVNVDD